MPIMYHAFTPNLTIKKNMTRVVHASVRILSLLRVIRADGGECRLAAVRTGGPSQSRERAPAVDRAE